MKMQLLLTAKDCQEILSVGNTKFYDDTVKDETFPKPVVIGKSKRWRYEDIKEWVLNLKASA